MLLTKSDFLTGHQCVKALWLRRHGGGLGIAPEALSIAAQLLAEQGQMVAPGSSSLRR
jgi:hypothetical protein